MQAPKPTTAEERAEIKAMRAEFAHDRCVNTMRRLLADLERAEAEVVRLDQNIDAEVASLRADLARARERIGELEHPPKFRVWQNYEGRWFIAYPEPGATCSFDPTSNHDVNWYAQAIGVPLSEIHDAVDAWNSAEAARKDRDKEAWGAIKGGAGRD